jgi:hypothetical protein
VSSETSEVFQNLTQNKKRKDDQDDIAFLLSFDLRDYPSPGLGFVPFGVPFCNRDLSRIELSHSPFA